MKKNKIATDFLGKRVKIVASTGGHGVPIGSKGTVNPALSGGALRLKEFPTWTFYVNDLELCPATREEIKEEISKLETQIKEEQDKLQFMSENNLEEYDETQFKVFKTLATLENKDLSQVEKSKLIASLISGK